jgi:hypothetical protein
VAGLRKSVIGAVYPLASGAAQFNGAMVRAMAPTGPVDVISWRRMYPPLLYRGQARDTSSTGHLPTEASFILDWHDPRTWRQAVRRVAAFGAQAVVLPWLHPVMAPPYGPSLRGCEGVRRARDLPQRAPEPVPVWAISPERPCAARTYTRDPRPAPAPSSRARSRPVPVPRRFTRARLRRRPIPPDDRARERGDTGSPPLQCSAPSD